MEELIKVTPDKEKAKSILRMVETTIEMVNNLDIDRFPSNITKEYYGDYKRIIKCCFIA